MVAHGRLLELEAAAAIGAHGGGERNTGEEPFALLEGLAALIERESARRLSRLGGSQPHLTDIPRRR